MKKILYKYIFKEILYIFLVSLLVFIFIALARQMMIITEWLFQYKVGIKSILFIISSLIPEITLYSLPAATLVSVILAFTRFSVDNEIIAMKSSGISLYQLLPPVLIISLVSGLMALTISMYIGPLGSQKFREITVDILKSSTHIGLKERIFSQPVKNLFFYVNNISLENSSMRDIFILDNRDSETGTNTIVAKNGKLDLHKGTSSLNFRLEDGNIFINDRDLVAVRSMRFKTYDFKIDLEDMIPARAHKERDPEEMALAELSGLSREMSRGTKEYNEVVLEMMERFSIPLAVFLMGLVGAPLGSQIKARGRLAGGVIGLGVFLAYYLCWAGSRSLSESGVVPPEAGPWFPPFMLLISSIFLFRSAAREKPLLEANVSFYIFLYEKVIRNRPRLHPIRSHGPFDETPVVNPENHVHHASKESLSLQLPVPLEFVPGKIEILLSMGWYVANIRTGKFHTPACRWASKIRPDDRFHFFHRDDAEGAGYNPCKMCRP